MPLETDVGLSQLKPNCMAGVTFLVFYLTNEDVDNSNNPPPLSKSSVMISDNLTVKVVGENSTESSMQPNQLKCDNTSIPGGLTNTECNDQSYSSKEPRVMQLALIPENGYGNLIKVQIGSASALALVDSGAQVSCLSHTFLKNINFKPVTLPPRFEAVVGVGGETHKVLNRVVLKLNIEGHKFTQDVHVLEGHHSVILGLDFLNNNNVQLNFDEGVLTFDNGISVSLQHPPRRTALGRTTTTVHILPNSEQTISLAFPNVQNRLIFMEPVHALQEFHPDLVVPPTVAHPQGRYTHCTLVNHSNHSIILPKFTAIGLATALFQPDVLYNSEDAFDGDLSGLDYRGMTSTSVSETKQSDITFDFSNSTLSTSDRARLSEFLKTHRSVFATDIGELGSGKVAPHVIDTGDAPPVAQRFYRANPIIQAEIDRQIAELLKYNIIEPSTSMWRSPVVLVRKGDSSYRFAIDFRKLNKVTEKISFPLVRVEDVWDSIRQKKSSIFSLLDLNSGFWQLNLDPDTKHKTGFVTQNRQFQFRKLPFGLCNAPATFQKTMTEILGDTLYDCALVYVDDVIVHSSDFDSHLADLERVLSRLKEAGLTLKPEKCKFSERSVKYLGHILSKDGIRPNPDKVKIVQDFLTPKTPRQVRKFLGLCNYYRRFMRDFGTLRGPLNDLLIKGKEFKWTHSCEHSFQMLNERLTGPVMLKFADPTDKYTLTCDASGTGIGFILSQKDQQGNDRVLAYGGRSLRREEKAYSITEREGLAVIEGIREYRTYLIGSIFDIVTDHKALTYIKASEGGTGRLARWALELAGCNYNIIYRKGAENINADILSWSDDPVHDPGSTHSKSSFSVACQTDSVSNNRDECDFDIEDLTIAPHLAVIEDALFHCDNPNGPLPSIAAIDINSEVSGQEESQLEITSLPDLKIQQQSGNTGKILNYLLTSQNKPLGYTDLALSRYTVDDGLLYHQLCLGVDPSGKEMTRLHLVVTEEGPVTPGDLRHSIMEHYHHNLLGGAHQGFDRTYEAIRRKYFWPRMYVHVRNLVQSCAICQVAKASRHQKPAPLRPMPIVSRFERWHIDFLGPLHESSDNKKYILLLVDSFSRWPEAFALEKADARSVAEVLYEQIFTRYGAPKTLVSDRGKQFLAALVASLCELFKVKRVHTSPYHPQTNATCERFNAVIGQAL